MNKCNHCNLRESNKLFDLKYCRDCGFFIANARQLGLGLEDVKDIYPLIKEVSGSPLRIIDQLDIAALIKTINHTEKNYQSITNPTFKRIMERRLQHCGQRLIQINEES